MNDLKFAFRQLLRAPVASAVAVLTLALGIGANTAIFSVVNALMLRMLPVADPSRLVLFGKGDSAGSTDAMPDGSWTLFSYPMFRHMRQNNHVFTEIAAIKSLMIDVHGRIHGESDLEKLRVQMISGSYFPLLGLAPSSGQLLTDKQDRLPGGEPFAVANYFWWRQRFGDEPFRPGKTVTIGSTVYSIIGVGPRNFLGTTVGDTPDLWIPLAMEAQICPGWNGLTNRFFQADYVIARLKQGVTMRQAAADINLVFKRMLQDYAGPRPTQKDVEAIQKARIQLTPAATGLSQFRAQFSKPLHILMGVVAIVLLIACANLANLTLARAITRKREFAIRTALGVGRGRLLRQLLKESALLAVLGGALGIVCGLWAGRAVVWMASSGPQAIPLEINLDWRVFSFTSSVTIATVFLLGMLPALRASRIERALDLKDWRGTDSGPGRNLASRALLTGQVAMSLVLLTGAVLFVRTVVNLTRSSMGFNRMNVLLFQTDFPSAGYKEDARLERVYREIEERTAALPGVQAASFSFFTFNQGGWTDRVSTKTPLPDGGPNVEHNVVGPNYFAVMGIPLLDGRTFGPQDRGHSTKVAVVNDTFARTFFPAQSAIGQHFRVGGTDAGPEAEREIIGVVKDAKYENLREEQRPAAYYPHSQRIQYLSDFEVRYVGGSAGIVDGVRKVYAGIDGNLPLFNVRTLTEEVDRSIIDQKVTTEICSLFALLALFLASIGIYGVTSCSVNSRTREIGIRMALGAQRKQILCWIVGQTLLVLAVGLGVGLPAIVAVQQLISSQLFGVPPIDPISLVVGTTVLSVAAVVAVLVPARRATRVDPMEALRYE